MKFRLLIIFFLLFAITAFAQYDPAAGQLGSLAISKDSSIIKSWVSNCKIERGYKDIANKNLGKVDYGIQAYALGYSNPKVISLGDSGIATLTYNGIVENGLGPDFCVFENSFNDDFLELAHVEVSSNGVDFYRFPSVSLVSAQVQKGSFDLTNPTEIYNLAGKHRGQFGTPFDLEDLRDSVDLNIDSITHIRIIDVVGSIDATYGSKDSKGNLINDPYPTAFDNEGYYTGGFDLDAVGLINYKGEIYLNRTDIWVDLSLQVYPNPVSDVLNIKSEFEITNVEVYSIAGDKLISKRQEDCSKLDLSILSSGFYFLRVYSFDSFSSFRVFKK